MLDATKLELRKWADVSAYFLVLISLFFLPVSTSLNALFVVAAFVALFGLRFAHNVKQILTFQTTQWTLALMAIFLIGVLYSSAPMAQAFVAFKKYGFRLFAFMVLPPLFCRPQSRNYVFYTLMAGSVLFSVFDVLDQAGLISIAALAGKPKHVVLSQLPFGFYCAFSSLITLFFVSTRHDKKAFFSGLLAYQCFYLFFINAERTPIIVFIVMAFVFLCRKLNTKQKVIMLLPAAVIIGCVGMLSPVLKERVGMIYTDVQKYQQGNSNTSLGLRAEFLTHSFQLIKQRPLFGFGTGSFATEYSKTGGPMVQKQDKTLGDPHNSYAHIWVQLGLVGVVVFLGWFFYQWKFSTRLLSNERILLRCFLIAFMLSCLSEASFYRSRNANLYLVLAAVCMGNAFQPRRKIRRYYKKR